MEYLKWEEPGDPGVDLKHFTAFWVTAYTGQQMHIVGDLKTAKDLRYAKPKSRNRPDDKKTIAALCLIKRH